MYLVARYYRGVQIKSMRIIRTLPGVLQRLDEMRTEGHNRGTLESYITSRYSYRVWKFEGPESAPKLLSINELLEAYRGRP